MLLCLNTHDQNTACLEKFLIVRDLTVLSSRMSLSAGTVTKRIWHKSLLCVKLCGSFYRMRILIFLPTLDVIVGGGHSCDTGNACMLEAFIRSSRAYSEYGRLSRGSSISRNSPLLR